MAVSHRPFRGGLACTCGQILSKLLATLAVWHARAESRAELARLDSRDLRDLNIRREDAEREARKPPWCE